MARLAADDERCSVIEFEHCAATDVEPARLPGTDDCADEIGSAAGAPAASSATRDSIVEQDADFLAFRLVVDFTLAGIEGGEIEIEYAGEGDPSDWRLCYDEQNNSEVIQQIVPRAAAAVEVWLNHFAAMGFIRADDLFRHISPDKPERDSASGFYLAVEPCDANDALAKLTEVPALRIDLPEIPGATLTVVTYTHPVNASLLYEAARQSKFSIGRWGGSATTELMPAGEEGRGEWLSRVSLSQARLAETVERWDGSGRNPVVFRAFGDHTERASRGAEIDALVDGRIYRGCFTIVVGSSSVGKSTMVHSWVGALGCIEEDRPRSVLGAAVKGRFVCALISGEDTDGIIEHRAGRHSKLWGRSRYLPFADPSKGLAYYLEQLWLMPVLDLIVVDPVRSFFEGDETSAVAVEKFCQPLLAIARAKNCAVILVHHVTKGSGEPGSIAELKLRTRGSSAFIDIARMVIGAVKRRDGTVEVGPVKYNFPAEQVWLPMSKGLKYWPDPETFTLQPVETEVIESASARTPEVRVLAAVMRCNRAGTVVRKSGKSGLFEGKLPELTGVSRNTILDAIAALVGIGELLDGEAGLIAKEWRPAASDDK